MRTLIFLFLLLASSAFAANPSFTDFNSSQFSTTGNKVAVKSGASITNPTLAGTVTLSGSSFNASGPGTNLFGPTTISYSLSVYGTETINSNTFIGGSLIVTGAVSMVTNLNVGSLISTGAVLIQSYSPVLTLYSSRVRLLATNFVNLAIFSNIFSFTVPANTLGTNKAVHVRASGDMLQNGTAITNLAVVCKFGSTTNFQSTAVALTPTGRRPWIMDVSLCSSNSTSQQMFNGFLIAGESGTAPPTGIGNISTNAPINIAMKGGSAETTTGDLTWLFQIQWGSGTNTDWRTDQITVTIE